MGNIFIGDSNNKAHQMVAGYIGVNGVARKIKAIYIGVDGVARKVWSSLIKYVTSYESINESQSFIIASNNYSYSCGLSAVNANIVSESENNTFYFAYYESREMSSNNTLRKMYYSKIKYDSNYNITSIKKLLLSDDIYGTNDSGSSYSQSYNILNSFEFGNYIVLLVAKYASGYSSSDNYSKYVIDIINKENMTRATTIEVNSIMNYGFAFNNQYAVISCAAQQHQLIVLTQNNGIFSISKINAPVNPNGYSFTGYTSLPIAKINSNTGLYMVYNASKTFACAFSFNNGNISFGTTNICGSLYSYEYSSAKILPIGNNNAIYVARRSDDSNYCCMVSIKIDNNLNITYGTVLPSIMDLSLINYINVAECSIGLITGNRMTIYDLNTDTNTISNLKILNAGQSNVNAYGTFAGNRTEFILPYLSYNGWVNNAYQTSLKLIYAVLK